MRYALNPNLSAVAPPPVAEAHAWARALPADARALLDLAQAVLLLAAHYYEYRDETSLSAGCMPFGATSLLARYVTPRLSGRA